jgi:hypothetical protein
VPLGKGGQIGHKRGARRMNAKTMAVKSVLRVVAALNLNWNVPRINFSESAVEIAKLDRTRFGSIGESWPSAGWPDLCRPMGHRSTLFDPRRMSLVGDKSPLAQWAGYGHVSDRAHGMGRWRDLTQRYPGENAAMPGVQSPLAAQGRTSKKFCVANN